MIYAGCAELNADFSFERKKKKLDCFLLFAYLSKFAWTRGFYAYNNICASSLLRLYRNVCCIPYCVHTHTVLFNARTLSEQVNEKQPRPQYSKQVNNVIINCANILYYFFEKQFFFFRFIIGIHSVIPSYSFYCQTNNTKKKKNTFCPKIAE